MSKKLIIGVLTIFSGIVTFFGILFMILSLSGSVSFLKNSITIISDSYQKEYDGESVDKDRYTLVGKLYKGDHISLEYYDVSKDVGTYTIYFDAKILNKRGKDVTENYSIKKNYGTLVISKREITLRVKSEKENYNGKELTPKEYEIINDKNLATGDILEVTLTGSITEIGEEKASLVYTIYNVSDDKKVNVTSNYKVLTEDGTLTKESIPLTIQSGSDTVVYDGKYHKVETYTTPKVKVSEDDPDSLHTEMLMDGDHIVYESKTNQVFAGNYQNEFDARILNKDGKDVTKNYAINKEYGQLTILKKEITITSGSKELTYDGEAYVAAEHSTYQTSGALADDDLLSLSFIMIATNAGTYDNIFYASINNKEGENVLNNYDLNIIYGKIVIHPKAITVYTKSYEKEYDGEALTNKEDPIISAETPLLQGDTLTAHFTKSITNAGTIENQALFSIRDSANKDVTRNYQITVTPGTLTVNKRYLKLKASSLSKQYDGVAVESPNWCIIAGSMANGQYLDVKVFSERELVNPGSCLNELSYQITNKDGQVLTNVLDNYEVEILPGILQVYEASDKKIYLAPKDTRIQYVDNNTVINSTDISGVQGFEKYSALGYTITCQFTGQQQGKGQSISSIIPSSIVIKDSTNNVVTNQFDISLFDGLLQVYEKEITIETASLEVTYDGKSHSNNVVTITGADGLDVVYEVTGSRKNVGESTNTIKIKGIYNSADTSHIVNIKDEYYISFVLGTIKVKQKDVKVKTNNYTVSIQVEPSITGEIESMGELAEGHTPTESIVTLDYVGKISNNITILIFDENNENVTYNYNIDYEYGVLELLP